MILVVIILLHMANNMYIVTNIWLVSWSLPGARFTMQCSLHPHYVSYDTGSVCRCMLLRYPNGNQLCTPDTQMTINHGCYLLHKTLPD